MILTWYGQSCFKIQSGDLVIAIDPFSKDIGLTPPRFRAALALTTHAHHDHNNLETLGGEPFVISGPGEYEVKGVYVRGIKTFHDEINGKERGLNTVYTLTVEGVTIAHLGDFGEKELREETLEQIGETDIALIPVGGIYTIGPKEASHALRQIEPQIAIPMHYKIPGLKIDLGPVEPFLKEMGTMSALPQEKLVFKKKERGEEEKIDVVVLTPGSSS